MDQDLLAAYTAADGAIAKILVSFESADSSDSKAYTSFATMAFRVAAGGAATQKRLLDGFGAICHNVLRAAAADEFGGGEDLFRTLSYTRAGMDEVERMAGWLQTLLDFMTSPGIGALREVTKVVAIGMLPGEAKWTIGLTLQRIAGSVW